jgi:D-xylose transport system permease protein
MAIGASIAICTLLGLIQGLFIAWIRIPSFVVTLGGFLIFEGFAYHLVQGNTINVFDAFIPKIGSSYLPNTLSWILVVLVVAGFVGSHLWQRSARARTGLQAAPVARFAFMAAGLAIGLIIVVATLNRYRGVPLPFVLLLVATFVFWFFSRRTRFGRHIYAVGGNLEASRRAGINTTAVRWIVFGISGLMAGFAGVMLLGYTTAASTTTAGPDLLLDVISIAVIGGVSLTGGKGSVWAVLLGGLLISSIDSGLNLMATDPNYVYIIKGAILLAAILIDTLGKRSGLPGFLRRAT